MATVTNNYATVIQAGAFQTVSRTVSSETFTTIRSSAATFVGSSSLFDGATYANASGTTNQFGQLSRVVMTFDTTSIPAGATITSAVITTKPLAGTKVSGLGTTTLEVVSSSSTSTTAIVLADYLTLGSTSFSSTSYASLSQNSPNIFTLNSSGLLSVNKGGYTRFGMCLGWDLAASFTGTWASTAVTQLTPQTYDSGLVPYITITYTVDFPTLSINNISSLANVTTITTS